MQTCKGSFQNLAALGEGDAKASRTVGSRLSRMKQTSTVSLDSDNARPPRLIICANFLPLRVNKREGGGFDFEWDEDSIVGQAKEGIVHAGASGMGEELEVVYVGTLPVQLAGNDQEALSQELFARFRCYPVFMDAELQHKYYKGFCKQQLWPLLHYVLPMSPYSLGRFDAELWQAYVRANMNFVDTLVELLSVEDDYVWIHDYHLLVLPSLLRKRFHKIRCGLFLHSPFPSSEIFRTFPKREEVLRSLLNADLLGFHTFDYARHFLSCCSRVLGLEHRTSRGFITVEYYGRLVSLKIMPTGIMPQRLLAGFDWSETKWRRGELLKQFEGKRVLVGVDDLDVFKGIELKLLAFERLLDLHPEWRGEIVLAQVTNAPRSTGREVDDLKNFVASLVDRINKKFGDERTGYMPLCWFPRNPQVALHERIAFLSVADCAVVTATRDGMNLVPYEYVACRQGPDMAESSMPGVSMLVVSEFVGCSPSLSGAIRVNPWSVDSVADGIVTALKMPQHDQKLRHDKHWRYVSSHTVAYWGQSYAAELQRVTRGNANLTTFHLGLGLDTFRLVALDANFRKLDIDKLLDAYRSADMRAILLDYDGTLIPSGSINQAPTADVMALLRRLSDNPHNNVYIISGRSKTDLANWFSSLPRLGLVAEHGFFQKHVGSKEWVTMQSVTDQSFVWKEMVLPILQHYTESTDGSSIEEKESSVVWHYRNADPDFGAWQAKELVDHLESVLVGEALDVTAAAFGVEVKPQNVTKGIVVRAIMEHPPPFVLCVGDDRSDDDMFSSVHHMCQSAFLPQPRPQVFACTVGQRPSKAKFYLDDVTHVITTLTKLSDADDVLPMSTSNGQACDTSQLAYNAAM